MPGYRNDETQIQQDVAWQNRIVDMVEYRKLFLYLVLIGSVAGISSYLFAQEENASDQSQPSKSSTGNTQSNVHAKSLPTKYLVPKPVAQATLPSLSPLAPASTAQLPNGASSVSEDYGDWTVRCRIENGQKACLIVEAQGNRQTGRQTFAIELRTPKDGRMDGTILMPFGLKFEVGANVKLDGKPFGQGLHFVTCVPDGCLLQISLPIAVVDSLKTGKTLSIGSSNLGNGEAVTFNASLNGFAPALARVIELGR